MLEYRLSLYPTFTLNFTLKPPYLKSDLRNEFFLTWLLTEAPRVATDVLTWLLIDGAAVDGARSRPRLAMAVIGVVEAMATAGTVM